VAPRGAMNKRMIFIAGAHNTGKTTLAEYLKKCGFLHVETSEIVRNKHQELAPDIEFHQWASEQGHGFDGFIMESVLKARATVENSNGELKDVVITGNRQLTGINYVCKQVPPLANTDHLVVFLNVNERILFERQKQRKDRPCSLTLEEFRERFLGYDQAMGIEKIKEAAHCIVYTDKPKEMVLSEFVGFLREKGYSLPLVESILSNPETELSNHKERLSL